MFKVCRKSKGDGYNGLYLGSPETLGAAVNSAGLTVWRHIGVNTRPRPSDFVFILPFALPRAGSRNHILRPWFYRPSAYVQNA